MQKGKVIKTYNSFYYVQSEGILVTCKLRGRFKKERCNVVTGDEVEFSPLDEQSGVIEKLLPRRNLLRRPSVANIDQVVLTFAAAEPDPHPLLVSRFLVLAEWSAIPEIVLCLNKTDLIDETALQAVMSLYGNIGYTVLAVSAKKEEGLSALREQLAGRVSVFAGPSGVGKSSLRNAMDSSLQLQTGAISDKIKRGRHTTRLAQLMPLSGGGFIVDTPGFSSFELERIDPQSLAGYFPEFRPYLTGCHYRGCTHSHEPGCLVKQAVNEGRIASLRYDAYLNILQEIAERKREYE